MKQMTRSKGIRTGIAGAALGLLVLAGLLLSLTDPGRAFLHRRYILVEAKVSGALPHISWPDVAHQVIGGRDFTADYFGMRYSGNSANLIDAHVLLFGAWEPHVLHFLRTCAESLDRDSIVFVDIGANTGLHSLFMSRYVGRVHAFDPYPPIVARFRAAVEENHLSNITIHQVGLGAADALLPFHGPPDSNKGTGSFLWGADRGNSAESINLEIVRGDAYFESHGIRADIIKMDIEGFEKPALQGLRTVLKRDRPIASVEITVEGGTAGLFESFEDLQAAFPQDYRFQVLTRRQELYENAPSGHERSYYMFYELADLDLDFQGPTSQRDVAAIPIELLHLIPPASAEE